MMKTVNGIVIKQRSVGDNDKYIDVLTSENGIMEISVKGVKKINSKSGSSTQLFAYSKFCINERKGRNILNSAEPIHIFYDLRNSLEKISLASYFADVLKYCITDEKCSSDVLRLFLNTLHFLEKNLRTEKFLKSIFELRLMSEIGLMPDVLACKKCGAFEPDEIYFSVNDGNFCCKDCVKESEDDFKVIGKVGFLKAVRHIVLSDFERLFNFRISDETQSTLSYFSEQYLISHLERNFNTLDFYKSLNVRPTP